MEASIREEIEASLANKSEETKIFVRAQIALVEKYVALMNANRYDRPLCAKLWREMKEKTQAMGETYVAERAKLGLGPELGSARV